MQTKKTRFSTQADAALLEALRNMAVKEDRQLNDLVGEALVEYVERKQGEIPRRRVMRFMQDSTEQYDALYRELAK